MAPKTLLLVEDSFTIQKLVESTFKSAGYQVAIANHAREGIASLSAVSPDIVLADASMPEMDGFQLCEVIRSTQGFERIPVLLLTSRFAAYDELQGQRSGVTAYLAKPFDSYSLLALVQQLIDNPSPQIDGAWPSPTSGPSEPSCDEHRACRWRSGPGNPRNLSLWGSVHQRPGGGDRRHGPGGRGLLLVRRGLVDPRVAGTVGGRPDDRQPSTTTRALSEGVELLVQPDPPWIGPGGNRVAEGRGAMDRVEPIDVALPEVPMLVLPVRSGWVGTGVALPGSTAELTVDDRRPEPRWYVELESGRGVVVDETLAVIERVGAERLGGVDGFTDPLPDGVVVEAETFAAALVGPTDRYPHGALGDRIEASAVEVLGTDGRRRARFGPEPPTVIEGLSAVVADATGDARPEILVTQSNADVGAWLALWSPDGELVAESDPIGQGNRWRNQLAVAPVGPGGEVEVIDVRTPHIGGTVQYHRVVGDRLERVAAQEGFTSHRIGSRNLDLGIVADADGDGTLDVVLPTDDRSTIGILTRTPDGVEIRAEVPLPGRMSTNLAVTPTPGAEGALTFAVGTDEAVLRIWPASTS